MLIKCDHWTVTIIAIVDYMWLLSWFRWNTQPRYISESRRLIVSVEAKCATRHKRGTTTGSIYAHRLSRRWFPSSLDHRYDNGQRTLDRGSRSCRNENGTTDAVSERPSVRSFMVGRYLPSFFLPLSETLLSIERERRWRVTGRLFTYFNLPTSRLPTSPLPFPFFFFPFPR